MGLVEASGVVLKSVKYGDNGRIFTILTQEFGKISASVSSLRNNKNGFVAGTQPFSYSKFIMFKSERENSIYRINECELINSFEEICESLEKVAYASYFADIAMRCSNENMSDDGMLKLLLNTLYLLSCDRYSCIKIKTVFEIKAISIFGYAPNMNECIVCRKTDKLKYFSLYGGMAVCEDCVKSVSDCIEINDTVIKIVNYIVTSDIKKIFSFTASDEMILYLSKISELFIEKKLEHSFKTLDYLKKVVE